MTETTNNHEENLRASFVNVKNDVIELKTQLEQITSALNGTLDELSTLKSEHQVALRKLTQLNVRPSTRVVIKKIVKKQKEKIIAAKSGEGKAHLASCPYGKQISKRIVFKTKTAAFKKGYKACKCLK